ncbi:MAG: 2-succinyl-5-enolpyruvyl-6-hydroxy-3-cyclohexene-1-carboxylic-acid synthase [Leptolyngbya sp. SIOISBB]|nr:2-succinyl-5-enolpyruvyl-6-hydroxy-3-cyclohexene-1-carboxylic-acid synthase [Leptolyngbya sp. SIOISBB]
MLDFRNTNTVWASVLVETLARLGLTTAVISPGSRSTPLVVACASHPQIQAIPILDERSASFFALGVAKASGQPTVLVCTSGTAGANYFPAVIEAYESNVPLLILTADRPPELRDCASGQTIDQQKLFGDYVRGYRELALPETTIPQLRYLRQVMAQMWQQSQFPVAGPVHINCPFRDPLAPIAEPHSDLQQTLVAQVNSTFFSHLTTQTAPTLLATPTMALPTALGQTERGLIIAGPHSTASAAADRVYCEAISTLAKQLGWPVLADGLSPLRNHAQLNPHLISTYDLLLRHQSHAAALVPEQVLQLGPLPTSKVLRQWLATIDPQRWILDCSGRNRDPLHGQAMLLPMTIAALIAQLTSRTLSTNLADSAYGRQWQHRDAIACQRLGEKLATLEPLFEAKLSWLLPNLMSPKTPLMIANSMPVRDVEWFWPLNDRGIRPYFSRGANGIDGTLSTAMGVAHHHGQAVLLTGDLALLHDSNGFLNARMRSGHLTILLINNQGGGIFESLPIAQFDPPFEKFFATPQQVDFAALATVHQIDYEQITTWEMLADRLSELPTTGVRLLELQCDRKRDAQLRSTLLESAGDFTLD